MRTAYWFVFLVALLAPLVTVTKGGLIADFLPHEKGNATRHAGKHEVCRSEECQQASKQLLASLDTTVDPCQDFYTFACGGWVRDNPVPPTESHRNQFDLVSERLDNQLRAILEEPYSEDDLGPVTAAKEVYNACMHLGQLEKVGLAPLAQLLGGLGGWPMTLSAWAPKAYSPQQVVGEMTRRLGISPLVLASVYLDRKNSSQHVVMIDQPSLVLPRSMLVEAETYGTQLDAYRKWIAETAYEVATFNDQDVAYETIKREAYEVVALEIELAKITSRPELRRNAFRTYNPMTLNQLQQWTDSATPDNPHARIDWVALLDQIFSDLGVKFDQEERVVVKEVDYLFELVALMDSVPPRVIANYLQWRLVRTMAGDTTKHMRQLGLHFDKVLYGIQEEQPRWRDCVAKTSSGLSHAVGYSFVRAHFEPQAKTSAQDMVGNIRAAFSRRLGDALWMDQETRMAAQDKADAVTQFIGYPDWYDNTTALLHFYKQVKVSKKHFANILNLKSVQVMRSFGKLRKPVDRSEWITSPDVVNAFYNPQTNSITFPAGILQQPFFSPGRVEALNYGSIGMVIGHEMTHGFDDMGRQSDKHGNLAQWWSGPTIHTYLDKAQCFVDQYASFRVPELDQQLNTQATMNGVATQGENIADNGGLNTAYQAYQQYVQANGPEPRLPGLQHLSPDQLFFIGFAQVWCETTTKEALLREVLTDPHSPHRLRVKGSLSNSRDFARAFHCPLDSPMNPDHKCLIW